MAKIKKAKLTKKTSKKQNFKKFIESGYTDIHTFLDACEGDENLLIYTCLKRDELQPYIEEMKKFETIDEQRDYLINNQPMMNETEERFNKCVESMAKYLKGYIEYNGFKLANADGDAEDWAAEFWAKYCKICEFYRMRWFHRDKLIDPKTKELKKTTVEFNPMQYKEFIFIIRMSISGERKHLAFLATQNNNSSVFRASIDDKLESDKDNEKTLGDILQDETNDGDAITEQVNVTKLIDKALALCKEYPDAKEKYNLIKDLYIKQNIEDHDKKTIILSKIFLYKAGLISPKILAFIKSLSATYKARYNISAARVNTQIQNMKKVNTGKTIKPQDPKKMGWRELILHKRGEL